ncbi:MAG TPA: RNA-binding protein [Blastocatellia bacterium]|nr:RNA-binding protein [Blastocatellia bacterium]
MSAKLFVGNLSTDTSSDDLRTLFSEAGVVESCQVVNDRDTGRSKGFGFIQMSSKEAADAAKSTLNGKVLHGKALKVKDAVSRNEYPNPVGYTGPQKT